MKKLKILPSVLMLIMLTAVFVIGVFALAPTQNTITGTITIQGSNEPLEIKCYLDEVKPENLQEEFPEVRAGISWTKGIQSLEFDTSKANIIEEVPPRVLIIQIKNTTSKILVAHFTKDGEQVTTDTLKSLSNVEVANVTLSNLTVIAVGDTVEMSITLYASDFITSAESQKAIINYGLVIDAPAVVPKPEALTTTNKAVVLPSPITEEEKKLSMDTIENYNKNEHIETLIIPEGVTSIEFNAEKEKSVLADSYYKTVVVPSTMTEINANAFNGCQNLEQVIIPEGVTSIGEFAFYNCPKLDSVDLPNGIENIGMAAFYSETGLTSIKIPSTVEQIGNFAFVCSTLEHVEIPGSVTTIGQYAIASPNIKSVIYKKEGETYLFEDGTLTILEPLTEETTEWFATGFLSFLILKVEWSQRAKDNTYVIPQDAFSTCWNLKDIEIPNQVTAIGEDAFYETALISVVIPDGVKRIERSCFNGCSKLENITLPQEMEYIGDTCFQNTAISQIILPEGITIIGNCMFWECTNLEYVKIPSTVKELGGAAFYGCIKLNNVELPQNLETMQSGIFSCCESLTSIVIPGTVTYFQSQIFDGCNNLQTITLNPGTVEFNICCLPGNYILNGTKNCTSSDYMEKSETQVNVYEKVN